MTNILRSIKTNTEAQQHIKQIQQQANNSTSFNFSTVNFIPLNKHAFSGGLSFLVVFRYYEIFLLIKINQDTNTLYVQTPYFDTLSDDALRQASFKIQHQLYGSSSLLSSSHLNTSILYISTDDIKSNTIQSAVLSITTDQKQYDIRVTSQEFQDLRDPHQLITPEDPLMNKQLCMIRRLLPSLKEPILHEMNDLRGPPIRIPGLKLEGLNYVSINQKICDDKICMHTFVTTHLQLDSLSLLLLKTVFLCIWLRMIINLITFYFQLIAYIPLIDALWHSTLQIRSLRHHYLN